MPGSSDACEQKANPQRKSWGFKDIRETKQLLCGYLNNRDIDV